MWTGADWAFLHAASDRAFAALQQEIEDDEVPALLWLFCDAFGGSEFVVLTDRRLLWTYPTVGQDQGAVVSQAPLAEIHGLHRSSVKHQPFVVLDFGARQSRRSALGRQHPQESRPLRQFFEQVEHAVNDARGAAALRPVAFARGYRRGCLAWSLGDWLAVIVPLMILVGGIALLVAAWQSPETWDQVAAPLAGLCAGLIAGTVVGVGTDFGCVGFVVVTVVVTLAVGAGLQAIHPGVSSCPSGYTSDWINGEHRCFSPEDIDNMRQLKEFEEQLRQSNP